MKQKDMPVANPLLVLREEFDGRTVLFDPDTGNGFDLNPVGVFVFNCLDGKHTLKDIYFELCQNFDEVPENAEEDVAGFVEVLLKKGYAGFEKDW